MLVRYFPSHHKKILIVAGSVIATYTVSSFLLKLYFRYKRNQKRKAYPKNTVILHQFPCKNDSPSMSTPCLKLETWLRIAEIKYEVFIILQNYLVYVLCIKNKFLQSRTIFPILTEGIKLNFNH
jgi:hypothetical protein